MTLLQVRVVALLRTRVTVPGQIVDASVVELAEGLGAGVRPSEVHAALLELQRASFFPGYPYVTERQFRGRLPG